MTLTFSLDIYQLKDMVEDKITYTFLDKHIKRPTINLHKISLLAIIMNETSLPITKQKRYIVAAMLVQIALDTHAYISEDKDEEDQFNRLSKQLSVLGGDYYSSIYYVLLSEYEEIDYIQFLATAIKEVNEQKMNFHFQTTSVLDEYIKLSEIIQSHIICSVAAYVGFQYDTKIITDLVLLDLLITEKEHMIENKEPLIFVNKQIQHQLFANINQLITSHIDQVEKHFLSNNSYIDIQFKNVFDHITHHYTSLMEEG